MHRTGEKILRSANLMKIVLNRALLSNVDLTSANLSHANLSGADLSQSIFIGLKNYDGLILDGKTELKNSLTDMSEFVKYVE
jgi:uncharacterized protein YjbI with pentapeptide repeats